MSNKHNSPKWSWLRLSITIVVVFISVLAIGLAVMEINNQFVTRSIYFFQHVNVLFDQMAVEAKQKDISTMTEAEQHAMNRKLFLEIVAAKKAKQNESALKEFSELERTKPEVTAEDINKKFELEYTNELSSLMVQIDTAFANNEKLRRLIPGIIGLIAAAVGGAAARSGRSKNNNSTTVYPNRSNNTNDSAKTVETVTKGSDATTQDQTDRRIE